MPISLPVFNLAGSFWLSPNDPAGSFADGTVDVQLYVPPRGLIDITPGSPDDWVPPIYLRISPAALPLDPLIWIWEVEPGSGLYYRVRWKQVVHQGFPNEYPMMILEQCDTSGVAINRDVV